jgi:drug/metabolite transporter (DMT)-like permease
MAALGWTMFFGTLFLLPTIRPAFFARLAAAPLELWLALTFLSLGCTIIGFAVWFRVLEVWPASRAGAFINLVPLFALLIGHLVLGEALSLRVLSGAGGVLAGVFLAGGVEGRSGKSRGG